MLLLPAFVPLLFVVVVVVLPSSFKSAVVQCQQQHTNVATAKRQQLLSSSLSSNLMIDPTKLQQQQLLMIKMTLFKQQQDQLQHNRHTVTTATGHNSEAPRRKFIMRRPCYFSPVQCLLLTPGQHRTFENHPKFNDHSRPIGASGADAEKHRHAQPDGTDNSDKDDHHQQQRVQHHHHSHRHHRQHNLKNVDQNQAIVIHAERPTTKHRNNAAGGMRRHRIFGNPWRIGL